MNKKLGVTSAISVILLIGLTLVCFGCSRTVPRLDYLSTIDGLSVTTTRYHPDVGLLPPPGMKYPSVFYESSSIGKLPPTVTGSLTLAPYGQESHAQGSSISVFEGTVVDVLVQADVDVFVGLHNAGSVGIDVMGMLPDTVGLTTTFGFFYENQMTSIVSEGKETKQHSTAMRTVYLYPGNYHITFDNYSTNQVQVTYSIWTAGNISNFHAYMDQCENIWGSGKYSEEQATNLQADIREVLIKNW